MFSGSVLLGYLAVVAAAALIQASIGFGFSIAAMMVLPYLFETYPQAAAVSSLLSVLTSLIVAVRIHQKIRWRVLLPCCIGYLVTAPAAIHYSTVLDKTVLTKMLGVLLILLGIYFIVLGSRVRIRPNPANGVAIGMLSGVLGGFFAVSGPPLVIYFLSSLEEKEEYSATIQCCFVLTGVYSAVVRVLNGIFTASVVQNTVVGAVAMAVGALIGYAIMEKLPAELLKKIIYGVMIFSGAKMLLGF